MSIKLKYFLVGEAGGLNKTTGRIDLGGIFDLVTSPFFPMSMPKISILMGFDGLKHDTLFELRINGPEEQLIGKLEFGVPAVMNGLTSRQIIQLDQLPIATRGKYTVDILEKTEKGYKFVGTSDFFTAVYPPQRKFKEGEIEAILSSKEDLIVEVKTDYTVPGNDTVYKFQLNLDDNAPILEGYLPFPKNDTLEVDGQKYDLQGIRRNIEWMFGKPKPKAQETETK